MARASALVWPEGRGGKRRDPNGFARSDVCPSPQPEPLPKIRRKPPLHDAQNVGGDYDDNSVRGRWAAAVAAATTVA